MTSHRSWTEVKFPNLTFKTLHVLVSTCISCLIQYLYLLVSLDSPLPITLVLFQPFFFAVLPPSIDIFTCSFHSLLALVKFYNFSDFSSAVISSGAASYVCFHNKKDLSFRALTTVLTLPLFVQLLDYSLSLLLDCLLHKDRAI